jgi:outer membrane protein OmpU
MNMKKVLLGSTALLGAGLMGLGGAQAAEVRPGGALDITVSGFARWYAVIGDIEEKTGDDSNGAYDFRNDTEVYVNSRATDEATGLVYGAQIELEADTDQSLNTDETFVFVRGNFGEFRFGDDDGAGDNMKIGAYTLAAFSGGLDGVGPLDSASLVDGPDSGDATKVIYYTPNFGGFQAGISYTPSSGSSGQDLRSTDDGSVDDIVEGGLAYRGNFGNFGMVGSVIGSWGEHNTLGNDDFWKVYTGLNVTAFGFTFGGGWGTADGARPSDGGGVLLENEADYQWYNVGAGAKLGPANVSVNWGHAYKASSDVAGVDEAEPKQFVFGVDFGVAPGLVVGGEVSWFDLDVDRGDGPDDDGVLGIVGIRLAF